MKTSIVATSLIALAVAAHPLLAQTTTKSQDNDAQSQVRRFNPADFDKQIETMREQMQKMQEQMNRIAQTQDPQERQRLLQEHWTSMQAAMSVMHGMWNPPGPGGQPGMMGPGKMGPGMMGWNHMRGYYSQLTPEQLRQRQYMMDQYLPMQQMMMDHMLWQQRWWTAPQTPPAGK